MAACWALDGSHIRIAGALLVSLQRTRQLTESATSIRPLSYGALPIAMVPGDPGPDRILVPVGQSEAFWLGMRAIDSAAPVALRVAVVEPVLVDAVTGRRWVDTLADSPQNYVVCPPQRGLDGVQQQALRAKQFARMPESDHALACHRLKLIAFPSGRRLSQRELPHVAPSPLHGASVGGGHDGLAGAMGVFQEILPDPFRDATPWSNERCCEFTVEVVSPEEYSAVTGEGLLPHLDTLSTYGGWRLP